MGDPRPWRSAAQLRAPPSFSAPARPPSPHPLPDARPRLPLSSGGWCAQASGSGSPCVSWRCGGPAAAMEVLAAAPRRRCLQPSSPRSPSSAASTWRRTSRWSRAAPPPFTAAPPIGVKPWVEARSRGQAATARVKRPGGASSGSRGRTPCPTTATLTGIPGLSVAQPRTGVNAT
ncbi:uncharacterized protein LOC100384444 [Zea mays]|uniref:Uncharacterized protein n=1 Tax=Zea mays TaxID=4577 RepID=C0PPC3_MAIZE|nr:uncharacterized protein LOC100384444 [Zea mays]ACN37039.1 unknown [Zea mays]|eukprot:NP_001170452.1 uncharacterized protein LOC100384444 [Zea mays]